MTVADARIVSLVPSLTETCFAFGLGAHLVGRTDFCISPPGLVAAVPSMGGPKTVDADALRAARPTHVLISPEENAREILPLIADVGAEAVVFHPLGPRDNHALYERLGGLFDRAAAAVAHSTRLDAALDAAERLRAETPELRVLPLVWKDPWVTVGAATYVAAMFAAVGLIAVPPGPELYPRIADLAAAAAAVDWTLPTSEPYPFDESHLETIAAAAGSDRVALVTGESVAWYGSRAIAGLRDLADLKRRLLDRTGDAP